MRICNWYTESPRYVRCANFAIEGTSRCIEHQEVKPPRQGELTEAERRAVLERYDYTCVQCGLQGNQVDHIIPLEDFSPGQKHRANVLSNLQVLCDKHHKEKTRKQLRDKAEEGLGHVNFFDTSTSARNRKKKRRRAQGIWYK